MSDRPTRFKQYHGKAVILTRKFCWKQGTFREIQPEKSGNIVYNNPLLTETKRGHSKLT